MNFHARWEFGLDFGDARVDPLGDFSTIFSGEHHRRADYHLTAVERGGPRTYARADFYLSYILYEQGVGGSREFQW
jgi:hypothetical protein